MGRYFDSKAYAQELIDSGVHKISNEEPYRSRRNDHLKTDGVRAYESSEYAYDNDNIIETNDSGSENSQDDFNTQMSRLKHCTFSGNDKICYESRNQAKWANNIRKQLYNNPPQKPYKCAFCGCYHLTSY